MPQKQEIKYQKKVNNKMLNIKKIIIFIFKHFLFCFDFLDISLYIFSFFNFNISFSDKATNYNAKFITTGITEENII